MTPQLSVSPEFDAIGLALKQAEALPARRKALEAIMVLESKTDLMRQLTGILWQKSSAEIVDLILDDLTAKELQSLWSSYQ